MTFQKALFYKIKTDNPTLKIFYNNGMSSTPPYFVMSTVTAHEQGEVFCDSNNTAGETLIQFAYASKDGSGSAEDGLESLHAIVKNYIGNIEYYEIWQNVTDGIRTIGGVANGTWDSIFESRFSWKKIS